MKTILLLSVLMGVSAIGGISENQKSAWLNRDEFLENLYGNRPIGDTSSAVWGTHIAFGNDPTSSINAAFLCHPVISAPEGVCPSGFISVSTSPSMTNPLNVPTSCTFYTTSTFNSSEMFFNTTITGLSPGSVYYYTANVNVSGGEIYSSDQFSFKTAPTSPVGWGPNGDRGVVFDVIGDWGYTGNFNRSFPLMIQDIQEGTADFVAHFGDVAYNLYEPEITLDFLTATAPLIANTQYHITPGNHESTNDFYDYRLLFGPTMPGDDAVRQYDSLFHSFNAGYAHIIFVSSEVYYYISTYGVGVLEAQYDWLVNDLQNVNRTETPWIIMGYHRPNYCSPNDDQDECHNTYPFNPVRDGLLADNGLEKLAMEYSVDLLIGAHEHSYESFYPVYRFDWNSSNVGDQAFVNPVMPINILNGAAGCPENLDPWQNTSLPFSRLRIATYGYGRIHVPNATHLYWEFIDDVTATVADSFWIVQENHGNFPFPNSTSN